jgi:carboxypeptidase Q
MFRTTIAPCLAFGLVVAVSASPPQSPAQNPPGGGRGGGAPATLTVWAPHTITPEVIDDAMNAKIRAEGMERSKIMWIEHYLTDVYGPRPTGSPNHVAAANWAIKTMTSWGMANGHLEPFTWRGIGWLPGRASGYITSPIQANLKFEALPWSPSTNGTVKGEVVSIVAPESPTEPELTAYLSKFAARVKGGIVMVGPPPDAPVNFSEPQKRTPEDQWKARYSPPDPNAPARDGRGGRGGGRGAAPAAVAEGHLTAQQVNQRVAAFLRDNMPALRITASGAGRIPGLIVAQNGAGQIYDQETPQSPGVILRNDDYGRIFRIIADGTPVSVEFTINNQYFPEGKTSYVTVAEIPGTDKQDEVVMLGGHLDSWASATGATDNAIGCAIMMEAARILQAVGAKPRRTIRVALWSGEEEGLLGSIAYVAQHFGMAESPKPEHAKLDAYWNIDGGTGQVHGGSIFGPPQAGVVLAQFLKPFEDWGVYGASTTSSRATGGTDSTSFNQAGLPGMGGGQDTIEYGSTTHHTNLDTYERIVPQDVMRNAVISASVVLHIANREKMMPRFSADEMPPLPPARGTAPATGTGTGRGR